MKRIVILILSGLGLLSCGYLGPVELDRPIRDVSKWGGSASSGDEDDSPPAPARKSVYVTGVEYPAGYDWRQAAGYNDVGGLLFLMKNGVRVLEVPIGAERFVSSDADMHRCIGGHLYTDFSTADQTVVKRDGVELFRYSGREMIAGMAVRGSDVYTLGQPRSGQGWAYRRNGEILSQRTSGQIMTGLLDDSGILYFVYEEAGSSMNRYIIVENGVLTTISLPTGVKAVDDVRLVDGVLWLISVSGSSSARVLYAGGSQKTFSSLFGAKILSGRFCSAGSGGLLVVGEVQSGSNVQRWLWKENTLLCKVAAPMMVIGGGAEWPGYFYVSGPEEIGGGTTIYDGSETFSLPDYDCLYGRASGIYDGNICVGLIDRSDDNSPVLWDDGVLLKYEFNGYFTSVSYW